MSLIRSLALSGTGLSVTTLLSVANEVASGQLAFKNLRDVGSQHLRLAIFHRQTASLPAAARMVCDSILLALDNYLAPPRLAS